MKILCVSDTTNSLAFSSVVTDVYGDVDLVISAGDMPLRSYDYLSTMLRKDVYYVYGNHNLEGFRESMDNNVHHFQKADDPFYGFLLDGRCLRLKDSGLILMGLGGCMAYNNGQSQYTEAQMCLRILRLLPRLLYNRVRFGRYVDILVTHAPPLGLGDGEDLCHKGFGCFLTFMKCFQPKYLIHGHVHLEDRNTSRITQYEKTTVVNIYATYVVDDVTLTERR